MQKKGLWFVETLSFEGVATNGSVGGASPLMGWGPCPLGALPPGGPSPWGPFPQFFDGQKRAA